MYKEDSTLEKHKGYAEKESAPNVYARNRLIKIIIKRLTI